MYSDGGTVDGLCGFVCWCLVPGFVADVEQVQAITVAASHVDEVQTILTAAPAIVGVQLLTTSANEGTSVSGNFAIQFPEIQTVSNRRYTFGYSCLAFAASPRYRGVHIILQIALENRCKHAAGLLHSLSNDHNKRLIPCTNTKMFQQYQNRRVSRGGNDAAMFYWQDCCGVFRRANGLSSYNTSRSFVTVCLLV